MSFFGSGGAVVCKEGFLSDLCLDAIDSHPIGILFEVILIFYAFVGLAIVCDEHLVPALETLCERWGIQEDVAGASFMAIGSAAPEIVINSVNTLHGDAENVAVGVNAILGSGLIAFLAIPALCAVAGASTTGPLLIKRGPLLRDISFYAISLFLIFFFLSHGGVGVGRGAVLVALYGVYISTVFFAPRIRSWWRLRQGAEGLHLLSQPGQRGHGHEDEVAEALAMMEPHLTCQSCGHSSRGSNSNGSDGMPTSNGACAACGAGGHYHAHPNSKCHTRSHLHGHAAAPTAAVVSAVGAVAAGACDGDEELGERRGERLSLGYPGYEPSPFSPVEVSAAVAGGCELASYGSLSASLADVNANPASSSSLSLPSPSHGGKYPAVGVSTVADSPGVWAVSPRLYAAAAVTAHPSVGVGAADDGTDKVHGFNGDDDDDEGGAFSRALTLACTPVRSLLRSTCPIAGPNDPSADLFVPALLISFLYLSIFAFALSAVISRWISLAGISGGVLGFALVAVGAEIPDTVQALAVARRGYGSMAVASCVGSQIANLLVGLALPWLLRSAATGEAVTLAPAAAAAAAAAAAEQEDSAGDIYFAACVVGCGVTAFALATLGWAAVRGHSKVSLGARAGWGLLLGYAVAVAAVVVRDVVLK